ncbi:MAG: hypothetical protein V3U27_09595, partial [Candidatus Tectomicrobia bacterium]
STGTMKETNGLSRASTADCALKRVLVCMLCRTFPVLYRSPSGFSGSAAVWRAALTTVGWGSLHRG